MKKLWLFALLLSALAAAGATWDLTQVTVNMPEKPTLPQQIAQKELELHLKLLAGVRTPGSEFNFYVGKRPANAPAAKAYESCYVIDGKNVYFYGDDRGRGRNQRYGTLFAVYTFLEKHFGILWVRAGNEWIVCKEQRTAVLPERETGRFYPPLGMSLLRNYTWQAAQENNNYVPEQLKLSDADAKKFIDDEILWRLRMRHMTRERFKYGHAYRDWQARFLKDHPEYFGLSPYGTRGLPPGQAKLVKLCLSNPAVIDRIIAEWEAQGKPRYLNVCPNDGTPGYCFCDNCRKLDADLPGERFHNHKSDRYVWFWNRVAERAVKLRKDVMIVTYVYSYYSQPPRRERIEYPDNILCGMVPQLIENADEIFAGWKKAGMKHCFFRPNYLSHRGVMPRGLDRFLYDTFQLANRFDFHGVDYDARPGRRSQDLEYYVVGRLIADPDKKFDTIIDEYASAFGAAAPEVKEYYARVRVRGEKDRQFMADRLKALKTAVLDDSELARFSYGGHTEKDLLGDLAVLEKGARKELSAREKFRLDNLIVQVKHQIASVRFYDAAGNNRKDVEKFARTLIDFRIANREAIKDTFGLIFGSGERKYWKHVPFYHAEVLRTPNNSADPAAGWRASFDAPGLMDWKARAAFVKVTDATASFDKFAVELQPQLKDNAIGIWRNQIPVTAGADYLLSWDFKFTGDVRHGIIRVVAEDGKVLLRKVTRNRSKHWIADKAGLQIPVNCSSIRIYVITGPGSDTAKTYVDNIQLKRLKK